jgi:hypothetical protein
VVSAVSGSSAVVPASSAAASPTAAADKVLNMLLQTTDMQQSLASHSQRYLPVTTNLVLSTLWGGINVSSSRTISEKDLQNIVVAEGGKASDVHALWLALNPPGSNGKTATTMDAATFAFNTYLTQAISAKLKSIQDAVTEIHQTQGPSATTSLLCTFDTFGGNSDIIGSGIFINVFV